MFIATKGDEIGSATWENEKTDSATGFSKNLLRPPEVITATKGDEVGCAAWESEENSAAQRIQVQSSYG